MLVAKFIRVKGWDGGNLSTICVKHHKEIACSKRMKKY